MSTNETRPSSAKGVIIFFSIWMTLVTLGSIQGVIEAVAT